LTTDPTAGVTRNPGGCLRPVLLRGRVDHLDGATGELLHRYTTVHEPGGVLPIACKTRRASQCRPCAEDYRADTYQVIRAGLSGGKGIPSSVAQHPCVFTTLTSTPASASSTTIGRSGETPRRRAAFWKQSGAGLPGRSSSSAVLPSTRMSALTWEPLTGDLRLARHFCDQILIHSLERCVWQGHLSRLRSFEWTDIEGQPDGAQAAAALRCSLRVALWASAHPRLVLGVMAASAWLAWRWHRR
jgi:hypothetical protein